ncbi:MAG: substrate-binding domain-containing protein [Desulfuromonadales bacterium]|nr:substrate-binding domain-containing protein [Desulfuromonadales bacterium]
MSLLKWVLCVSLLLHVATAAASADTSAKVLRVYGPGGPHHVLQECAELFRVKQGVAVTVIRALPNELGQKLAEDGDIYYGGAEYMLEDFDRLNPGVLNMTTVEQLHPRRIGIIVRKGNPLGIKGVAELSRPGVDLLDVKLEKMRNFHGEASAGMANIRRYEYTGRQGFTAWSNYTELDAWVTYRSWHLLLGADEDFIEIPGDHALRYTPVAVTKRTPHRQEALAFISFLKSTEARQIFEKHGWN